MTQYRVGAYQTQEGYMTAIIRNKYIKGAVEQHLLPKDAHRMENILSLTASDDMSKPIQFWQLYSVLGPQRIVDIVSRFYNRVFNDEVWFKSVFERIASKEHHINAQSAMWVDVMGGGQAYHGGEYRLNFHHTHNAMELMNDKGAAHWISLMRETLDEPGVDYTDDSRVRPAINTFLSYFMQKYAADFNLNVDTVFGDTNAQYLQRINFMNMTSDAVEALSGQELTDELNARGIDTSEFKDKQELISRALSL